MPTVPCYMVETRSWLQCVGCVDIADRRHRLIVASSVMYSWIPILRNFMNLSRQMWMTIFFLMLIVPCCCMISIHAGNGIWFECKWTTVGCCCCFHGSICMTLMCLPAEQLFNGMRFRQRVCWWARYFGSRVKAMEGKANIMPPVCCILRMCDGIGNAIIFLDFFGDHSYEIVMSKSGYPTMQCEYYCALCNGLPTLLQWFCFVRSWCDQSFKRPLPTALMQWPVAGYATYEWWIAAMMIFPIGDIRSTPSLVSGHALEIHC